MNHLQSILMGISNFFLCYFTCWLFFSKRLKFLESKIASILLADSKLSTLESRIDSFKIEIYMLDHEIKNFNKRHDEFEAKSDILNRISRLEGIKDIK